MLIYSLYSFSVLFIILSLSNFLKIKLLVRDSAKYLTTVLILIIFLFAATNVIKQVNLFFRLEISYLITFNFFFLFIYFSFIY